MDTVLLVITILSLAAAFISLMAVRRLKHADQQRSDARVAALATAATLEADPAHHNEEGRWNSVAGEWQWKPPASGSPRDEAGRELFGSQQVRLKQDATVARAPAPVLASGFDGPGVVESRRTHADSAASNEVVAESLFGTVRRERPASNPFAFVAAAALLVALGGAVVVFTTSGHKKSSASVARAAHTEPLELVSLGHARDASTLTITGIVRNPATGPKLEGLTAVVSLIDGNGGLISTKDVPLDYRALGPGEEAPFKVTVPDPGSVARYRVSFRAGTDVVPHVDRRSDTKLASAL